MSGLPCPHCGGMVALRLVAAGEGASAPQGPARGPRREGPPSMVRAAHDEHGEWVIENCPQHGRHRARAWAASQRGPAVVKCQARLADGGYCKTAVPRELADRQAEGRA